MTPSRKTRKQNERKLSGLYSRMSGADWSRCAYCGDPKEVWDHVPPLALAVDLDLEKFRKAGGRLSLIPACSTCNSLLGSKPLGTYVERLEFLYQKYGDKIAKEKALWSPEEVEELGRNLRIMVDARVRRTQELVRKLRGVERALAVVDLV